jgi:hypothetical protein
LTAVTSNALLSWPRVPSPELQPPCREVTEVLLELWADFLKCSRAVCAVVRVGMLRLAKSSGD